MKGYADEELFAMLKNGDERALNTIFQRYWEPLYKMAASTIDELLLCEDIVQDIFIKIWENRETLNLRHSLKAYLFASTRYAVFRQVKLRRDREEKLAIEDFQRLDSFNPHSELEYKELLERVEGLVGQLPERCREVYQLSRNEHLSRKEIASLLNLSSKTVENQLTIALRKIRSGLHCLWFLSVFLVLNIYFIMLWGG